MPRLGDCIFLHVTDAVGTVTCHHALVTAVWGTSDLINCVSVLEVGAARWRGDNVLLGKIQSYSQVPHIATPEAQRPGVPVWSEQRTTAQWRQLVSKAAAAGGAAR